jgi:hypothetical protein
VANPELAGETIDTQYEHPGADTNWQNALEIEGRAIEVHRKAVGESLDQCQTVFIATSAIDGSARVFERLRERPVLAVADSPGAMRRGVVLNMAVAVNKVTFEANQQAARSAGLSLSSNLLSLATRVQR